MSIESRDFNESLLAKVYGVAERVFLRPPVAGVDWLIGKLPHSLGERIVTWVIVSDSSQQPSTFRDFRIEREATRVSNGEFSDGHRARWRALQVKGWPEGDKARMALAVKEDSLLAEQITSDIRSRVKKGVN